jgi:hypothetical protein
LTYINIHFSIIFEGIKKLQILSLLLIDNLETFEEVTNDFNNLSEN